MSYIPSLGDSATIEVVNLIGIVFLSNLGVKLPVVAGMIKYSRLRVWGREQIVSQGAATGIVLAGGHSTRMGRDKARVVLQGRSLLEWVLEALRQVCDEVLVVTSTEGLVHQRDAMGDAMGDAVGDARLIADHTPEPRAAGRSLHRTGGGLGRYGAACGL